MTRHIIFIKTILIFALNIASQKELNAMESSMTHLYKDDLNKAWLDLKPAGHYCGEDIKFNALCQMITHYHSIPKTQLTHLTNRLNTLRIIAKMSSEFLASETNNLTRPIFQHLIARANLKRTYLEKLPSLRETAHNRVMSIPYHPTNTVINAKRNNFVGLDPEKRMGHTRQDFAWMPWVPQESIPMTLFEKWSSHVSDSPETTPDYFLWLEEQDTSCLIKDLRYRILSDTFMRVSFREGFAYNAVFRKKDEIHVKDGSYLYNVSEDGDLYILPNQGQPEFEFLFHDRFNESGKFRGSRKDLNGPATPENCLHHDNLLGGANILSAGILEFKDGQLVYIDVDSGHYLPDRIRHLRPALALLLGKQPGAISPDTQIGGHKDEKKKNVEVIISYADLRQLSRENDDGGDPVLDETQYKELMKAMGQNVCDVGK